MFELFLIFSVWIWVFYFCAAGVEGGGDILHCQAWSVIPNSKGCLGLKVETAESERKVGMVEIRSDFCAFCFPLVT